jgi:hypothetical protein
VSVRAELQRQAYTEVGTLGRLRLFDAAGAVVFTCLTAENEDRGNRPGASCIPEGEYKLVPSRFNRGNYDCFEILLADGKPIPGRSLVKIHVGNSALDVEGCVVLGYKPVAVRDHWGVGPSNGPAGAFAGFMAAMREHAPAGCPLTIFFRKG